MTLHAAIRQSLTAAAVAGAALLPVTACQAGTPAVTVAAATASPTDAPAPTDQATGQPTSVTSVTAAPATSPAATGPVTPTSAATPTAAASIPPVGQGSGGPGSLTVAITSPVTVSGHIDTPVSCAITGARYTASASGTVHNYAVSDVVRVAGYHGPGTYPALVTVSVTAPDNIHYVATGVRTTAQITDTGGAVSFSATTSGGRTLAGSIGWACSA
ncbi:MAG: hypothetical protein ACQSGP_31345 [Frankia sp.]